MITRFSTLYVGHIELERCGLAGVPADDRRYSNERLAETFDTATALARAADTLGYETLWLAEHHFQHEGYECIPSIPMLAVDLAYRTERVKIGCAFNVVPAWHPLRLAEDYAVADILTGGRVVFGVGRGYHTREVETFGNPMLDAEANRELFEEQVEIILKSFREESFSHHGKYYTLPPEVPYRGYTLNELTVVPRPLRLPVECWQPIQGGTARALDFMAKHGIRGLIGGGSAEGGAMHKVVLGWQEAHARRGQHLEMGEKLCFGFHFYLAKNREEGIREAAKYYEENMKMFGELRLVRALSDEQIQIMRDPKRAPHAKLPRIEDAIANGGVLCGSPEQVIEHLKSLERRYPGLDRVSVSLSVGVPKSECLEQLEWFGKEVLPEFQKAKVAEPAFARGNFP